MPETVQSTATRATHTALKKSALWLPDSTKLLSAVSLSEIADLADFNVALLVLDSCRYDSLAKSETPLLDRLGIRPALTHGSYTLPSHTAFFSGYLPRATGDGTPFYDDARKQLIRLGGGRSRERNRYGFLLHAATVPRGFAAAGYRVRGFGGVPLCAHDSFQRFFPDGSFHWFGGSSEQIWQPRPASVFALNHIDQIVSSVHDSRYFLYLNCHETHAPYDWGDGEQSPTITHLIHECAPLWGCKAPPGLGRCPSDYPIGDLHKLRQAQINAASVVDRRLQRLVEALPKPLILVVCADHGEAFGELELFGHGLAIPPVLQVPLSISGILA